MIITSDNVLGDVVRDKHDSFVARPKWRGKEISVHLMVEKNSSPNTCVDIAREIVKQLDEHVTAGCTCAAAALVKLANEWRQDQKTPEFDSDRLSALFDFDGLLIFEDGTVEFFFRDGGVFAGHAVIVDRTPNGTFGSARFEG
jgi:hypothetical protein